MPTRPTCGRRDCGIKQFDEPPTCSEGFGLTGPQDGGCNLACEAFFAVLRQHAREVAVRIRVEHVRRGQVVVGIHPHVQRGVDGVGESAIGAVELHRRHTEIEERTVDVVDARGREDVVDAVESRLVKRDPVAESGEAITRDVQG